jgi:hypothetical protein
MSTRPVFEAPFDQTRELSADFGSGWDSQSDRQSETDSCACDLALDDALGLVYNEEAFRYFLEVERKRSELSNRPFVLLLVDLTGQSLATLEMDVSSAQKLLLALSVSVRETDFIGWYRARSVAGAVLTQHSDAAGADLQEVVSRRIAQVLRESLPAELASLVRVRIYQLPSAAPSVT